MLFKGQQVGKYKIVDAIGSGGFGSVYLAKDTLIGKTVAIKIPHKQGDDFDKLLKEPRMLAALDHPNIVSVITADKTNNIFYIVMEYVDGVSLEQYLRKKGPLGIDQALVWFLDICSALAYAHSKKVLHRDIRPANVLISRESRVKVTDFGTSRFLDSTFASTKIGSPPYMAPEHFRGRATLQSDIYSMGILMYECLTGRLPFFDPNPQRVAEMAREGKVKAPHHRNGEISLELSRVVLKAMHPSPSSRYPRVNVLVTDLKHVQLQRTSGSQDLAKLVEEDKAETVSKRTTGPKAKRGSHGLTSLFCWNCERPISKRTRLCPHCNVKQH